MTGDADLHLTRAELEQLRALAKRFLSALDKIEARAGAHAPQQRRAPSAQAIADVLERRRRRGK